MPGQTSCKRHANAKAIWANAHPMSSEELITKQAEMVYAQVTLRA